MIVLKFPKIILPLHRNTLSQCNIKEILYKLVKNMFRELVLGNSASYNERHVLFSTIVKRIRSKTHKIALWKIQRLFFVSQQKKVWIILCNIFIAGNMLQRFKTKSLWKKFAEKYYIIFARMRVSFCWTGRIGNQVILVVNILNSDAIVFLSFTKNTNEWSCFPTTPDSITVRCQLNSFCVLVDTPIKIAFSILQLAVVKTIKLNTFHWICSKWSGWHSFVKVVNKLRKTGNSYTFFF